MRLILTRHGQSTGNVKRIISGYTDSLLTDHGREQAALLATRLATENIFAAFSSDLSRASQTADEVLKLHDGITLEQTPLLRERNFGIYEQAPLECYLNDINKFEGDYWKFEPTGGETLPALESRALRFIGQLTDSSLQGKTVLICAHHSINKMLIHCLLKRRREDWMDFTQSNTCVNIIDVTPDEARQVILDCTSHLK